MRRDVTRDQVTEYVRRRLQQECAVRGRRAEIARRTKFTPQHVSLVALGKVGVGDVFLRALLAYWGIDRSELERLANPDSKVDRYPNRTAAARLAAEMKEWPPESYGEVFAETPTIDPCVGWWFLRFYFTYQRNKQALPVPTDRTA